MTSQKNEKLESELFEITTGLLLGHGNLQRPKTCKHYRVRFAQNQHRLDIVFLLLNRVENVLPVHANGPLTCQPLIKCDQPDQYEYLTAVNKKRLLSFSFQTRICSAFDLHAQYFY